MCDTEKNHTLLAGQVVDLSAKPVGLHGVLQHKGQLLRGQGHVGGQEGDAAGVVVAVGRAAQEFDQLIDVGLVTGHGGDGGEVSDAGVAVPVGVLNRRG